MAETFELDIWLSWGIIGLKSAIQHKSFTLGNLNVDLRIMIIYLYYGNLNKFWELGRTTGMFSAWFINLKLNKLNFLE